MTTIAYDGKTVAADTQQTGDFIDQIHISKIEFDPCNKKIIGIAGNLFLRVLFEHWIKDGEDFYSRPDLYRGEEQPDFAAIVIEDGVCYHYGADCVPFESGVPYAIGTGAPYAMGAMMAGASAREAVEIAIKLDIESGGEVDVLECPRK